MREWAAKAALLPLLALALPAQAGLLVTGARARPASNAEPAASLAADVDLSGVLRLRGVELVETPGDAALRLPLSGSSERGFADLRLLSKALHDGLLSSLRERKFFLGAKAVPGEVQVKASPARRRAAAGREFEVEVLLGGELSVLFGARRSGASWETLYPTRRSEGAEPERLLEFLDDPLRRRVEAAVAERAQQAAAGPLESGR